MRGGLWEKKESLTSIKERKGDEIQGKKVENILLKDGARLASLLERDRYCENMAFYYELQHMKDQQITRILTSWLQCRPSSQS